jgi:pyruvate kinase
MQVSRATKIVATLGPASSDPQLLEQMVREGVNVVRLNFSHGKAQDHIDRATMVREAAQRAGREVAIMADLQGPRSASASLPRARSCSSPASASCSTHRAPNWATSTAWAWITRSCPAT